MVVTKSTRREAPIKVHYESLGTYHEIYGHYLIIVRSVNKKLFLHTFKLPLAIFEVLGLINDNAYKVDLSRDYGVSATFNIA